MAPRHTPSSQPNDSHFAAALKHCETYKAEYAYLTSLLDDVHVPIGQGIALATVDAAKRIEYERERQRVSGKGSSIGRGDNEPKPPPEIGREAFLKLLLQGTLNRLFLTGDGGTGKTEYTRLLALRLAEAFQPSGASLLPYRVELKSLGAQEITNADTLFERLVRPSHRRWLVPLADAGRVAFMLDGLDELPFESSSTAAFFVSLKGLVADFNGCSFILAGRPGSLPAGLTGFNTYELRPLSYAQIEAFARTFYGAQNAHGERAGNAARDSAADFIAQIRTHQSKLDPLIFTPFMAGFALRLHAEGKPIPENPAELVEQGLIALLTRRRPISRDKGEDLPGEDVCLEALRTIAAFTQAGCAHKPDSRPAVGCSVSDAACWLADHKANISLLRDASDPRQQAHALIDRLAPGSGVLSRRGDHSLVFTNRVLAEFLAASWIAGYGYPNWPYRDEPYVSPECFRDDSKRRSLFDLFGDLAFSHEFERLILALRSEVGRRDPELLLRIAEWTSDTAKPFNCTTRAGLDARETLNYRVFRYLEALPDSLESSQLKRCRRLATTMLPPDSGWFNEEGNCSRVRLLPYSYRSDYLGPLLDALAAGLARSAEPEERSYSISSVCWAIASCFAESEHAMQQVISVLREAAEAAVGTNLDAFISAANEIAFGFMDNMQALRKALAAAAADPKEKRSTIDLLSDAIESGLARLVQVLDGAWKPTGPRQDSASVLSSTITIALDEVENEQGLDAWCSALATALAEPRQNADAIVDLANTFVSTRFRGNERALDALREALAVAAAKPKENWCAIAALANAVAWCSAGHEQAAHQALDALYVALDAADPGKDWNAIDYLADTIVRCFEKNEEAMLRALKALREALASVDPKKNRIAITSLSNAIASGFEGNERAVQHALDAIWRSLDAAGLEKDAVYLEEDADEMMSCFAEDEQAMWRAFDALCKALAEIDLAENRYAIVSLANAIASGFEGDKQAMLQALDALCKAIAADPRMVDGTAVDLACSIASGFAGNDRALAAIRGALDAAATDPDENWDEIMDLSGTVASTFQGSLDAAASLARAKQLNSVVDNRWAKWVCLSGTERQLRELFVDSWGIPESEILRTVAPWKNPDEEEHPAIIVCPRERIRRGLPAKVLDELLRAENYFHNSENLSSLSAALRQEAERRNAVKGKGGGKEALLHAANWLDALLFIEKEDPVTELDRKTRGTRRWRTLDNLRNRCSEIAGDGGKRKSSVKFPYSLQRAVPELGTIKQANAGLTDMNKLVGRPLGPLTDERIEALREAVGLRPWKKAAFNPLED